jgi:hypothetical protein
MRNLGAMLLMGTLATSVMAEWVRLGVSEKSVYYLDAATVQTVNGHRQAWDLWDVAAEVEEDEASRLTLREFDCHAARFRVLAFSDHAGRMGQGKAYAQSQTPGPWQFAKPSTLPMLSLRKVCTF